MGTVGSLPPKKGKGKLPLFRGNGERVNPIYVPFTNLRFESKSYLTIPEIFDSNAHARTEQF